MLLLLFNSRPMNDNENWFSFFQYFFLIKTTENRNNFIGNMSKSLCSVQYIKCQGGKMSKTIRIVSSENVSFFEDAKFVLSIQLWFGNWNSERLFKIGDSSKTSTFNFHKNKSSLNFFSMRTDYKIFHVDLFMEDYWKIL